MYMRIVRQKIPTARLNEEMLPLIEAYPPPSNKGKYIKIKYITQLPNTQVPFVCLFCQLAAVREGALQAFPGK